MRFVYTVEEVPAKRVKVEDHILVPGKGCIEVVAVTRVADSPGSRYRIMACGEVSEDEIKDQWMDTLDELDPVYVVKT